ncbi:MAG: DUF927 domain-containing protein [Alkalibacterium gilvum]|uniref:DUF927 domain-containing protein n=1 Tax=Alkalibacterium gilvum TaxID=1130080 RepID=UPI003F915473
MDKTVLQADNFTFDMDDGITYVTEDGEQYCSLYARIKQVFIDSNTQVQSFGLEYINKITHKIEIQHIPYSKILPNGIMSLMEYGLDVTNKNRADLSNALIASLRLAETIYINSSYGFDQFNGQRIFVSNRIHSARPVSETIKVSHDRYDLKPSGTVDEWIDMYESCVRGNPELELAVVFSLSSPILAYLKQVSTDINSLLIHLSGDSTTGKTTALSLAISVAGNPNTGEKSLLRYWNGTLNSVMASLEGIHGIPIAFDELSTNAYSNLTSLVYSLTDGVGRSRANMDGSLREVGNWSTVMLSSGELSIYNRLSHNIGLRVRVFDFENTQWTTSAEQAERIKNVTSRNNGHILPAFVDYLFSIESDDITSQYESQVNRLIGRMPESNTRQRVARKLAIILTAAELVNESGILQVDTEAITDILVAYEVDHIGDRNLGALALDKLMQYLLVNKRSLTRYGHNTIGYLENNTVCIYRDQLSNILKKIGFEDSQIIVNRWIQSNDIITTEQDRNTTRKVIDGRRYISYKIKIPEPYVKEGLKEFDDNKPINSDIINQKLADCID